MSAKSRDNKKKHVSLYSDKLGNVFQSIPHLSVFFDRKCKYVHDGSNMAFYFLCF